MTIYEDLAPTRGLVIALVGLAYVDRIRGRLERALEHNTRALEFAEKLGDPVQTASHGVTSPRWTATAFR